jgi:hypothetical protein
MLQQHSLQMRLLTLRSKGVDVVISQQSYRRKWLTLKLVYGTISTQKVSETFMVHNIETNGQVNKYYSETSRIYLEKRYQSKTKFKRIYFLVK